MRILIVTPWYPTTDAPQSGIFVAREAAALAQKHDVRVIHLDWSGLPDRGASAHEDVVVRRVPLRRANPLAYLRARRLVARAAQGADVVHTHALTGLLPWACGRPSAAPWVHSEHWSALTSPETLGRVHRLALRALAPLLRKPQTVVVECQRLASAVRRHRSGPLTVVPCVVPAADIHDRPANPYALIGIGGLVPRKNPLLALDTVAALRARGHRATLTWVGPGPLRRAVEEHARTLGLADDVRLTGALAPAEVAAELDRAAMLILPTRGDNFCVVVAEALTHGRAVVSGAATGAVDYAQPSVARFVAPADAAQYADAVEDLVASTRAVTAEQIAATVAGLFTPDAVRSRLEDVYRDAIAHDTSPHRAGRRPAGRSVPGTR